MRVTSGHGSMGCPEVDPKGVGVLTTRTRYSGKRHRQRFLFGVLWHSTILDENNSTPWGTYHPTK